MGMYYHYIILMSIDKRKFIRKKVDYYEIIRYDISGGIKHEEHGQYEKCSVPAFEGKNP